MTRPPGQALHRRAARLGWATLLLSLAAALLLGCAIWLLATSAPRIVPDADLVIAILPVDVELTAPRPVIVLCVGLVLAAFLVAMAAQQTVTALRVLSRGRGLEQPVPIGTTRLLRRVLGPRPCGRSPWTTCRTGRTPPFRPEADVAGRRCAAPSSSPRTTRRPSSPGRWRRWAGSTGRRTGSSSWRTTAPTRPCGSPARTASRSSRRSATPSTRPARSTRCWPGCCPTTGVEDVVLVMDADSTITLDFLDVALGLLDDDPDLVAVGGLFSGEDGARLLGQLQRNEFTRYQRVHRAAARDTCSCSPARRRCSARTRCAWSPRPAAR